MVRSSIINKRYNSNEVRNHTVKINIHGMRNPLFQLHQTGRILYSIGIYYTKNQSLCYALLNSLINEAALTDF